MNKKSRAILALIFSHPTVSDLRWTQVEALLKDLGAQTSQGAGSRVRCLLKGRVAVFHRPHPAPTVDKGMVRSIRRLLEEAGFSPKD